MKRTIIVETTKEIEVEFPVYFKLTNKYVTSHFAIFSDKVGVAIWSGSDISKTSAPDCYLRLMDNPEYVETSSEEFEGAMDAAYFNMKNIIKEATNASITEATYS